MLLNTGVVKEKVFFFGRGGGACLECGKFRKKVS